MLREGGGGTGGLSLDEVTASAGAVTDEAAINYCSNHNEACLWRSWSVFGLCGEGGRDGRQGVEGWLFFRLAVCP